MRRKQTSRRVSLRASTPGVGYLRFGLDGAYMVAPIVTCNAPFFWGIQPEAVKVRMGGEVVKGNVLHVPRSSVKQVLKINAAGFEPLEMHVVADKDKTINVELVKKSGQAGVQPPGKPPEAGQAAGQEGQQPGQQKKTKLDFVRDFPPFENEEEKENENGKIIKGKMGTDIITDYGE